MHGIILRNSMTVQLFVGLSVSPVPVRKQKHLYQLIAFAFFFCRWWRLFSTLLSLIFFFHPDGIFLGRHLRHLFFTRFIKSTFSSYNVYNNRNHVHSPQICSHVQRASRQGLAKKSEETMMTKENLFMCLKVNVRCQFVYSQHSVLAKVILRSCVTRHCTKNGRFEYFDGTNPITEKGVTYSILQRFRVMLVS